jgi:hypothetical protein
MRQGPALTHEPAKAHNARNHQSHSALHSSAFHSPTTKGQHECQTCYVLAPRNLLNCHEINAKQEFRELSARLLLPHSRRAARLGAQGEAAGTSSFRRPLSVSSEEQCTCA